MMGAAVEGVADRYLVGMEAVRADLWRSDHALAKVLHEQVRILAVALAGAIADDGLGGRGYANERILSARWSGSVSPKNKKSAPDKCSKDRL
jgi:hypothetical protein